MAINPHLQHPHPQAILAETPSLCVCDVMMQRHAQISHGNQPVQLVEKH